MAAHSLLYNKIKPHLKLSEYLFRAPRLSFFEKLKGRIQGISYPYSREDESKILNKFKGINALILDEC